MQLLRVSIFLCATALGFSSLDVSDATTIRATQRSRPIQAAPVTDQDDGVERIDRVRRRMIQGGVPRIGGNPPRIGDYNPEQAGLWDTKEDTPITSAIVRCVAVLWITLVASLPCVITKLGGRGIERSQLILFCWMWVVFFAGIFVFTNGVLFQSVHFTELRSLSLIEAVYFMSQILTTVGYGDITPAKPAGQVVVGAYCLFSFVVIATIVTTTSDLVVSTVTDYSQKMEKAAKKAAHAAHAAAHKAHEAARTAAHKAHEKLRTERRASGITDFADIEATPENTPRSDVGELQDIAVHSGLMPRPPPLEHHYLVRSLVIYLSCVVMGVIFFTCYPDEEKTVFQAIYMSVITLSTVGFGAFTPVTEVGLVFSSFWMVFGSMALGSVVGSFTTWQEQVKQRELWNPDDTLEKQQQFLKKLPQQIDKFEFLHMYLMTNSTLSSEHLLSVKHFIDLLAPDASGDIDKRNLQSTWIHSDRST